MKILIDSNTRVVKSDNYNWVIEEYKSKKDKEKNY